MTIYPKLETRRAKRRNGAAYQHRRLRSLTGGHSVITHGRRMEYQRSHSMFLTHVIAGTASASRSDRASLPRKWAGNAISRGSKKAKQDGTSENRTRVTPLHTGLLSDSYRTQTQNPRRHPRRPGMRPTSAPTSARDPLYANPEVLERTLRTLSAL